MNKKKIRVVVAEDQEICQQIWQSYLAPESDLEIIGTAIDGQGAIELVDKLKPDVVLMDINMTRMDGLTATEIICDRHVHTKILVLGFSEQNQDIQKSFQLGAKGYVLRSCHPQELVTAIRNIHQGYIQLGLGLMEKLYADKSLAAQEFNESDCHSAELITHFSEESSSVQPEETLVIEASSNLVSPHFSSNRLLNKKFRLLILLFAGLLAFFWTTPGRKWAFQLTNSSKFLSSQTATAQDSKSTTILPVQAVNVKRVASYQVDRTYAGTIVSRRSSELGFERSGKLLSLEVDKGDFVIVGTPIAILDKRNLNAQKREFLAERKQVNAVLKELQAGSTQETIAAAQSTVNSLKSQIKLADSKSQRRQELYASGVISREQLDEATTEVNTLQARIDEAQSKLDEILIGTRPEKIEAQQAILERLDAKLASLELKIEKSILRAPFTGRIANRLVDEGTVVSTGQTIFTLVESSALEVQIGIPVTTATQISLGSNHHLYVGSQQYQAKVLSKLPQLDSATRSLTIVLGLDETAAKDVRAGQIARMKLSENIVDSGYWLPTTALVKGVRGLWSCYVLGKPQNFSNKPKTVFRVEQREIEVIQTESERVFVSGTLQEDDQVIVNGNHRLVSGQMVVAK